jgi:hypothetical protein
VLNEKSGTKYKIQNVTTGIEPVLNVRQQPSRQGFYTLDGRFAGTDYNSLQRGIYVTNGKKVVR